MYKKQHNASVGKGGGEGGGGILTRWKKRWKKRGRKKKERNGKEKGRGRGGEGGLKGINYMIKKYAPRISYEKDSTCGYALGINIRSKCKYRQQAIQTLIQSPTTIPVLISRWIILASQCKNARPSATSLQTVSRFRKEKSARFPRRCANDPPAIKAYTIQGGCPASKQHPNKGTKRTWGNLPNVLTSASSCCWVVVPAAVAISSLWSSRFTATAVWLVRTPRNTLPKPPSPNLLCAAKFWVATTRSW